MIHGATERDLYEIENRIGGLLGSQNAFLYAPEHYKAIFGGYGSGKSRVLCAHGLILSAAIPGNVGLLGRYHATDLEDSLIPMFFEVCPPSWVKKWNSTRGRQSALLFNNSLILFRHIHDPNPKRSHITSMNLGWAGVDQVEEIDESDYLKVAGRLRLPRAPRKFLLSAGNPAGKDWNYRMFFAGHLRAFLPGEMFQVARHGHYLGIASRSEENKKSNGGFVEDEYYETLRETYPPEWIARYLDCSFEDFSGKVYREYSLTSVHNIDDFQIPKDWPITVSIDVGGEHPWAVLATALSPAGQAITFKEFHQGGPQTKIRDVAGWIKGNLPWSSRRVTYVIDPENKPVSIELAEYNIHATPAVKHLKAGVERVKTYMHLRKNRAMPRFVIENFGQDDRFIRRLRAEGIPSWYIVKNSCPNLARELDSYVWDEGKNKPKKDHDDGPDSLRYGLMALPPPPKVEPYDERREEMFQRDPGTAKAWDEVDRFWKALDDEKAGRLGLREAFSETSSDPPLGFRRGIDTKGIEW